MKIFAIFRGFPGLGRVISGIEIIDSFKELFNVNVKLVTYLQGIEYAKIKGYFSEIDVSTSDISSLGIIPVSKSGELIINEIENYKPDLILIDGEPLLVHSIKISYPEIKIISLLNPFDINNPHNQKSSREFFLSMFAQADISIVHGLWAESKPLNFKKFISINSIVRKSISKLKPNLESKNVVCLLGGGSKTINRGFFNSTVDIARQVLIISKCYSSLNFTIQTSDNNVKQKVLESINQDHTSSYPNVKILSDISSEEDIYKDVRLIIARAGRNTISEILVLGMPSIIIPTQENYRGSEQNRNCEFIEEMSFEYVKTHRLNHDILSLKEKFASLLKSNITIDKKITTGNIGAIEFIVNNL